MNKRGDIGPLLWIFYIFLVAVIVVIWVTAINNVTKDLGRAARYNVIDGALLINTAYASPGELEVKYSLPNELYFQIDKDKNILYIRGEILEEKKKFYSSNKDAIYEEFNLASNIMKIKREKGKIIIEDG